MRTVVEKLCNEIESVELNNDNLERQALEIKKSIRLPKSQQGKSFEHHINTIFQLILSNLQIVNGNLDTFRNYMRLTSNHMARG